ncbi:hypothetical protein COLO4_10904 [Corchorus olitorius]|uniref:Uncharacterized protein n=1 Tax=Corchorus olitorius TaxID=93759 RepID=A0A1R3K6H3_9ROSI|nr:hypothetical protein COLO4_10904 [Corchorus olitorius]
MIIVILLFVDDDNKSYLEINCTFGIRKRLAIIDETY